MTHSIRWHSAKWHLSKRPITEYHNSLCLQTYWKFILINRYKKTSHKESWRHSFRYLSLDFFSNLFKNYPTNSYRNSSTVFFLKESIKVLFRNFLHGFLQFLTGNNSDISQAILPIFLLRFLWQILHGLIQKFVMNFFGIH